MMNPKDMALTIAKALDDKKGQDIKVLETGALTTLADYFVLCTATSKPTVVVTPILEEQGLAPYFDFIGGASMDESRDTKTEVVRYVLTQPCVQGKRVLMVGDRNDDMRGAADCGLDAAGALYGYGSREELEPFGPVLLAESCEELTDKLLACRANG